MNLDHLSTRAEGLSADIRNRPLGLSSDRAPVATMLTQHDTKALPQGSDTCRP